MGEGRGRGEDNPAPGKAWYDLVCLTHTFCRTSARGGFMPFPVSLRSLCALSILDGAIVLCVLGCRGALRLFAHNR